MPLLSQVSEPNIETDPAQMLTELAQQVEALAQLGARSAEKGEPMTAMDATQTLSKLDAAPDEAAKSNEMTDGMM